jgi:hypothetical protein
MQKRQLQLSLLDEMYGICVFPNNTPIPEWVVTASWFSITRTRKELTIVCQQSIIPSDCEYNSDWRLFRIDGSFDLNQVGVISSLAVPLAQAGISIFVVSSYDTDYFLIKERHLDNAIAVLTEYGHTINRLGTIESS